MLFFTRWKAAAILLLALVVCLFALPNFFSENVIRHWPSWAQRHIVLGLDLQGGSHLLLEVESQLVRGQPRRERDAAAAREECISHGIRITNLRLNILGRDAERFRQLHGDACPCAANIG